MVEKIYWKIAGDFGKRCRGDYRIGCAGRLTEKYARPAIVEGIQDGVGRGSARSIDGFEMVEVLNGCQEHLIKYGGHAKAAG